MSGRQLTPIYCSNARWFLNDSWIVGVSRSDIFFFSVIITFFLLVKDSSDPLNKVFVFPMAFFGFEKNSALILSPVRRELSIPTMTLSLTCKITIDESELFFLCKKRHGSTQGCIMLRAKIAIPGMSSTNGDLSLVAHTRIGRPLVLFLVVSSSPSMAGCIHPGRVE